MIIVLSLAKVFACNLKSTAIRLMVTSNYELEIEALYTLVAEIVGV
jgi:hypothetical protein